MLAELDFLQNSIDAGNQKLFLVISKGIEERKHGGELDSRASTVRFERTLVQLNSIRDGAFSIEKNGFEVHKHESSDLDFATPDDAIRYKLETQDMLYARFPHARYIFTWDFQVCSKK